MRLKIYITTFCFLFTVFCFAQKSKQPKNIESAIHVIDETVSDSITQASKKLTLIEFKEVFEYQQPAYFQLVNTWLFHAEKKSKLIVYYEKLGVYETSHIRKILLNAYYRHLKGKEISHDALVAHYRDIEEQWLNEDKDKLNVDTLRGNYIPEDLKDCFSQIDATCPKEVRDDIKSWDEEIFVERAHFGLGLWIINTWRLWEGSRLSDFFNNEGIYQPNFMTDIILKGYHQYLNQKDVQLSELVRFYRKVGEKNAKLAITEREKNFAKFKQNDVVYFRYHLNQSKQEKAQKIATCFAKGKVLELNAATYSIRVRVLDICDDDSILFYDNAVYDREEKNDFSNLIKHLEAEKEYWFNFEDWEKK